MTLKDVPDYGMKFPKPDPSTKPEHLMLARNLYCAYHNCGLGSFHHRKWIISKIWPEFQWNRWSERMLRGFCESDWLTWMAGGGSGKSKTAATIAVGCWLEAPDRTAVIV